MPDINLSRIQQRLQTEVAKSYLSVEYNPDDVLSVALTGVNLNDVNIIIVNTIEDLPNLKYTTFPSGMIYFINNIGIFAINSTNKWLTLDGITLRTDTSLNEIWSWGCNNVGQLGDNTVVDKSSPVSVVGVNVFTDWRQVSAGLSHSLAVRQNGIAWAWGCNGNGRLGDNTDTNKSSPVSVVGGFTDWSQVSAGSSHSLGIRQNGIAWAWGYNGQGRLGDNTTVSKRSPVSVVGGFCDWCQVSAGGSHSLGVRTGGTAWAWGAASSGILGDNTVVSKSSPVSVVGGFCDWCQVSAGQGQSLGVRQNGTAWAWGGNTFGQLGIDSVQSRSSPNLVVGGFTDWCQVSAGNAHSLAVRQNGTAWAWGFNTGGTLGDNTSVSKRSPVSVVGGFTNWCQVSAGRCHSLGVRQNGTAWAWGNGTSGQLGDNTTVPKSSPVSVVGGFCDWGQVSAGGYHSLGLRLKQ
jgi:alpha-tubulin suppressor-like RCC1 family protein